MKPQKKGNEVKTEETVPEVAAPAPIPSEPPTVPAEPIEDFVKRVRLKEEPPAQQNLSFVEEVLALTKKLDSQRQAAIDQLLAEQKKIQEQLALLGFQAPAAKPQVQRRLSTVINPAAPVRPSSKPSGTGDGPFCRYCSESGHDARAHRGQAVKTKFSASELAALKK
jgi:hypothetical protein